MTDAKGKKGKGFGITWACDLTPRNPRFLWDGRIPRGTERDAIERDAAWRGPRRSRIDPRTYRSGHFVVNGGGLRFVPTRGMTNGEPAWFRRRVERARRQKAAEAFVPTVRVPALTPPPSTGDSGRASRTERRRMARKAASRPSDDDGPGDEPASPEAGA
jgi:hypothetical protein